MQKTIFAPYHAIKYSRYSCDLTIIKLQLLHHVLQFDIQILLSVTVNNQKLTEGRTIPKYRDAIASKNVFLCFFSKCWDLRFYIIFISFTFRRNLDGISLGDNTDIAFQITLKVEYESYKKFKLLKMGYLLYSGSFFREVDICT